MKKFISWYNSRTSPNNENLTNFISSWKSIREDNDADLEKSFESYIYYSKTSGSMNENLLQAYLYLNKNKIFPNCSDLLIYERSLWGNRTDRGKVDMIFMTKNKKLLIVETKFLDRLTSGPTQRTKRRKHRQKVIDQVLKVKEQIVTSFHIPEDCVICAVFTTDSYHIDSRATSHNIISKRVEVDFLNEWLSNYRFKSLKQEEYEKTSFYSFRISDWP
jgi:hypothetical protein